MGSPRRTRPRPTRRLAAAAVVGAAVTAAAPSGSAAGFAFAHETADEQAARAPAPQGRQLEPYLRRVPDGRLEPGAYRGFSAYLMDDVPREGEQCIPSSLWTREIRGSYELGCEEIQEILQTDAEFVGEGRVRKVYVSEYREQSIAVKVLQREGDIRLHRIELATMDAVRGNPNVIQPLGVCNSTLVTEAYRMDIQSFVRALETPLSILQAITMSLDAVRGLRALHEAADGPIVHYDMKPAQMLVTGDGRVKLNDFNVAWFMGRGADGTPCPFNVVGDGRQPGPWRTPEYLGRKPMTEKVDIYRMGMVFQKFIVHEGIHDLAAQGGQGGEYNVHTKWHGSYKEVVKDMILEEPELRPSAGQVAARMEAILRDLEEHS